MIWEKIPFNLSFEVSSDGKVREFNSKKLLKIYSTKAGYQRVSLNGTLYSPHRLVAETFIGPSVGIRNEVNHKNGDPSDNRVENLEWVSASENAIHARRILLRGVGEKHGNAIFTETDVLKIRELWAEGKTTRCLAKEFKTSHATVLRIVKGKAWRHLKIINRNENKNYSRRVVTVEMANDVRNTPRVRGCFKKLAIKYGVHYATIRRILRNQGSPI